MIKINPAKAILVPVGANNMIVSGIGLRVNPTGTLMTIGAGRVKINSLFMDMNFPIETDFSTAPMGLSLMVLTQTLNLIFVEDNTFNEQVVIGVVDRKNALTLVTPVNYTESAVGWQVPTNIVGNVFDPSISAEAQIRMLFEELAINKTQDIELRYEELLEALPVEYNSVYKETFANTANFVNSSLTYNSYARTISLGVMPPYPVDTRVLTQKIRLPMNISKAYLAVERLLNGQTCNIRISFDNGITWTPFVEEGEITAGVGCDIVIEFSMKTNNRNVSPLLRSWAIFYNKP